MTEGIKINSIPDLIKRVKDEWKRKEKEAEARKKELEENMRVAIQKEKHLKAELKKYRLIAEKMEKEYQGLESKLLKEKEKEIKKNTPLESDVREGKISLKRFQQEGKYEKDIQAQVVKETQEELSLSLEAIRAKNLEIMNLEHELIQTQHRVRQLMLQPGLMLKETLEKLKDFTDREMSLFFEDYQSTRSNLQQMQHKMNIIEKGVGISRGFSWDRCSPEEAKKIAFDPILPENLVPSLLQKIESLKEYDALLVRFSFGRNGAAGILDVSPAPGAERMVKNG